MFDQIWEKQKTLITQFEAIELKNNQLICAAAEIKLDCPHSQQRLKEMAWRVVEEIGEATEIADESPPDDYHKEMMDVYSFLIELIILSRMNPDLLFPNSHRLSELYDQIGEEEDTDREIAFELIENLAIAMNQLKNKPWKQKQNKVTDTNAFYYYLELAHFTFIRWANKAGITEEKLCSHFLKTAENNQQRINDHV